VLGLLLRKVSLVTMPPIPVVLDTDIGTDVDDALALVSVLGSETLRLVGITTVYVDAPLRADIASRLLRLASADHPVWAGESRPLRPIASRAEAGAWEWHEGRGILYDEVTAEEHEHLNGQRPALRPYQPAPAGTPSGVDELVRLAREHPGLHVICIGPLTNIASAMIRDPDFADLVGRLVVLGGFVVPSGREPRVEHNFCSDVGAAEIVFRSATPITLLTADVTQFSFVDHERLEALRALQTPLARTMDTLISIYFERKDRRHTYMHDPLTVAIAGDPDLAWCEETTIHLDPVDGRTRLDPREDSVVKEVLLVKDVWLKRSQQVLYERLQTVCSR
jgi:purine nucleosidase